MRGDFKINGNVMAFGAVSSRTLLTEDLIKSFSDELARVSILTPNVVLEARDWLAGESQYRESWNCQSYDESGAEIVEALINEMNNVAPKGVYFGTQEGDGACFGWWQDE